MDDSDNDDSDSDTDSDTDTGYYYLIDYVSDDEIPSDYDIL